MRKEAGRGFTPINDEAADAAAAAAAAADAPALAPALARSASVTAKIRPLVEMGFDPKVCDWVLEQQAGAKEGNYDYNAATQWLTDPSNEQRIAEISAGLPEAPPLKWQESRAGGVGSTVEAGESPMGGARGQRAGSVHDADEAARATILPNDMVLLDLMTAKKGSVLYRLGTVLSRIEDLSHILVWSRAQDAGGMRNAKDVRAAASPAEAAAMAAAGDAGAHMWPLSVVELPRLKLRFQPRADQDGVVRLWSLDQSGWFVSDNACAAEEEDSGAEGEEVGNGEEEKVGGEAGECTGDSCSDPPPMPAGPSSAASAASAASATAMDGADGADGADGEPRQAGLGFLAKLLDGIPHCLVLENGAQELQVLVPSHEVRRPYVKGQPFGIDLVFDRTSQVWQDTMGDNRVFLYPVHTSRTYLMSKTLDSAMYVKLNTSR